MRTVCTCKRLLAFGAARPRLWERVLVSCDEQRVGDLAAWLAARRHLVKVADLWRVEVYASTVRLLGTLAGGAVEELSIVTPGDPVNLDMLHLPRLRKLSIWMTEYLIDEAQLQGSCSQLQALESLRVRNCICMRLQ